MLTALITLVLGSAVFALATALVLMLIAPLTCGRTPTFGQAYLTMFLAHVAARSVRLLMISLALTAGSPDALWLIPAGWLAGFPVLAIVISRVLGTTLPRAAATALAMTAIAIVLSLLLDVASTGVEAETDR